MSTLELDATVAALISEWRAHRAARPNVPDDYAAHVDHLRQRMDAWEARNQAYRVLIGDRLAESALDQ